MLSAEDFFEYYNGIIANTMLAEYRCRIFDSEMWMHHFSLEQLKKLQHGMKTATKWRFSVGYCQAIIAENLKKFIHVDEANDYADDSQLDAHFEDRTALREDFD